MNRPAAAQTALRQLFIITIAAFAATATGAADEQPARHEAPGRIVAIGDLHGDLEAARAGLRMAGAIDDGDRWIGGDLVVVQTGDVLDRGGDEQAILDLLARLGAEAAAVGGAVYALLGNHELMNAAGDFRYVTDAGWADFADAGIVPDPADTALAALPAKRRPRAAAFKPGGPYARLISNGDVVLVVGRTAFVHGGVLPEHVAYGLERLNRETRAWLLGLTGKPTWLAERDSPVWARHYSDEPDSGDCALLDSVLAEIGCDRMVVGHTVQEGGIAPRCGERVWCIDTGASAAYGGEVQVLEITDGDVRVLR